MFAFYKDQDKVYKLYDHKDDWQVIYKEGNTNRERWCSVSGGMIKSAARTML